MGSGTVGFATHQTAYWGALCSGGGVDGGGRTTGGLKTGGLGARFGELGACLGGLGSSYSGGFGTGECVGGPWNMGGVVGVEGGCGENGGQTQKGGAVSGEGSGDNESKGGRENGELMYESVFSKFTATCCIFLPPVTELSPNSSPSTSNICAELLASAPEETKLITYSPTLISKLNMH